MSSQLTQRDSLDTESELAPQKPPPWDIRWAAWLLIVKCPHEQRTLHLCVFG
jgi:hypothetical protein